MSGLEHGLGQDTHVKDGETVKVEWPSIDANDRAYALASAYLNGAHRGHADGKQLARVGPYALPVSVPPKHLKWHCETSNRNLATEIAATQLPAASLRDAWLDGYKEGVREAWAHGSRSIRSPGGDPDQQGE